MKWHDYVNLIGIALLLFLHFCDNPGGKNSLHTSIDTIYIASKDPVHNLPTKEYVPYKVEVPGPASFFTIPANIDSGAVVRDYFSKRSYQDSTGNDSVKVYFSAYTFKNELRDLKLRYRIITPTMVIREAKVVNKQLVFLGMDVCSNGRNLTVYPGFYFDLRKGMLGAGYDPFNKTVKVGGYFKLSLWSRK